MHPSILVDNRKWRGQKALVSISTEEPDRSDKTGDVRVLLLRNTHLPFKVGHLGVLAATWRSVESGPLFLLHI